MHIRYRTLLFFYSALASVVMDAAATEHEDVERKFYHARKNYEAGLYDLAADELKEFMIVARDKKLVRQSKLMLAESLYHLGDVEQAASMLARILADQSEESIHPQTLYWLGECRLIQGEPEIAAGLFSQVVEVSGELAPTALNGLGRSYFAQKEYDQAIEVFDRITQDFPDTANVWMASLEKSRCLLKQEKQSDAKKLLLRLLDQDKDNPQRLRGLYLLGEADFFLGNFSESLEYYQMALADTEPKVWHPEARYSLGWCNLKMENYEKAIEAFDEVVREYSLNPGVFQTLRKSKMSLGKALFLQGDYDRARQTIEDYIKTYEEPGLRSEAWVLLGDIFSADGKYEQAIKALDGGLALEPGDEMVQQFIFRKGEVYYSMGEYQAAIDQFDTAASMENATPGLGLKASVRVGDAYIKLGLYGEGALAYNEIIENYPDYATIDSIIYRMGWCYYKMWSDEKAIETFSNLTQKYPQSNLADDALYRIGGVYYRRGDYDEAMEIYRRTEKEYPSTDLADKLRYQLAKSNYNLGFFELALGLFKDFSRNYPESELRERAAYEIGWCYYQLGRIEDAMKHFKSLITENSGSGFAPEIIFWMAEIHYGSGEYAEARELFSNLEVSYPQHHLADGALYWAGRSSLEIDQPDTAMVSFTKLRSEYPGSDFDVDSGLQLGKILYNKKEYSAAEKIFQKLNSDNPGNYLSREIELNIAGCKLERGGVTVALKIFSALSDDESIDIKARALIGKAMCYNRQNQSKKAVQELMRVAWDFPAEREIVDEALMAASGIYESEGEFSLAVKLYSMVVDRDLPSKPLAEMRVKALKKRSIFGF
jgi:TolA-binding protein